MKKTKKNPKEWMDKRVYIFEKICLPSILNQTNKDFIWLLSFSEKTPPYYYEKYQHYPFIKIIFDGHF